MSQVNNLKTGGLVLKRADLQVILNEPDTLGIAFALYAPGVANDVDMQVLKVSEVNGMLVGKVYPIAANRKKGAPSNFHYPATKVQDYVFSRLDKLQADGYYFGYLEKASLLSLFASEPNWTEVFIGGGQKSYPEHVLTVPQTDWFSIIIALRKSMANQNTSDGLEVKLPTMNAGRTSVQDILAQDSDLLDKLQQAVSSIIKGRGDDVVAGLAMANGDILSFPAGSNVQSIQLDANQQLAAVYTKNQALSFEESIALGSNLPYFRWAHDCPPQWTEASQSVINENANLRMAVEKALQ